MLIICPKCDSAYEVAAAAVMGRKRLRCAACDHEWAPGGVSPPAVAAAPPPSATPALPEVAPPARQDVPSPPARRNLPLLAAWVASLALLAGFGWGALHFRAQVERGWPASVRAYALLRM
jgi:predicted Zn finger-like uncharacterized protein